MATELRQYKLPEGPVLREVVLKEEISDRQIDRHIQREKVGVG